MTQVIRIGQKEKHPFREKTLPRKKSGFDEHAKTCLSVIPDAHAATNGACFHRAKGGGKCRIKRSTIRNGKPDPEQVPSQVRGWIIFELGATMQRDVIVDTMSQSVASILKACNTEAHL